MSTRATDPIISEKNFGGMPVPGLFTSNIDSVIGVPLGIFVFETKLRLAYFTASDSELNEVRISEPRVISDILNSDTSF